MGRPGHNNSIFEQDCPCFEKSLFEKLKKAQNVGDTAAAPSGEAEAAGAPKPEADEEHATPGITAYNVEAPFPNRIVPDTMVEVVFISKSEVRKHKKHGDLEADMLSSAGI